MSAPDPKEWQLQQDELDAIECNLDIYGIESRELQDPVYAVARRRALAELKALAKLECSCCRSAEDLRPGGFHYDCEGKYLALCDAEHIHDRIAEIEAEG